MTTPATAADSIAVSSLPLNLVRRGKVRDVYDVDDKRLLMVATDRVSAFDIVMQETVPYKGAVLTQLTAWWLKQLGDIVPNHMLSADIDEIVELLPELANARDNLVGRAMLVQKATVFPVECVIRGYLSGSGWKEYQQSGAIAGMPLPTGLVESSKLNPPAFTPATKAETGHDENISIKQMGDIVGADIAGELERLARAVYQHGCNTVAQRGIIIADTKFEFGYVSNNKGEKKIILIDEVMTPDSSRFWPAEGYAPGKPQPSFDKQPLRDYLDAERKAGRWNGESPPPALPDEVITSMSERYLDAFERITGAPLDAKVEAFGVLPRRNERQPAEAGTRGKTPNASTGGSQR